MRAVVQRVKEAWVQVSGEEVARIGQGLLQVVIGKMEVTAQADLQGIADKLLQLRHQLRGVFAVVSVAVVSVRRGHHVGDPVGRRCAAHGDARLPGLGTVVYFRKNVGVNINHDRRNTSTPLVLRNEVLRLP